MGCGSVWSNSGRIGAQVARLGGRARIRQSVGVLKAWYAMVGSRSAAWRELDVLQDLIAGRASASGLHLPVEEARAVIADLHPDADDLVDRFED